MVRKLILCSILKSTIFQTRCQARTILTYCNDTHVSEMSSVLNERPRIRPHKEVENLAGSTGLSDGGEVTGSGFASQDQPRERFDVYNGSVGM